MNAPCSCTPGHISARVVEDSYTNYNRGRRITTMVLEYPRFIHSEFMTHRVFSRNASSSRAIPVQKSIQRVLEHPVVPIVWSKNQPGMQAAEYLQGKEAEDAEMLWLQARNNAVQTARDMLELGLHKQVINRILEPFSTIVVVVTATEWNNFFGLRCHPDAEPHMQALAKAMKVAREASEPILRMTGEWHLPFVSADERKLYKEDVLTQLSVARCARVSYLNHDGTNPDPIKDLALHEKLRLSGHMSPFEHQAQAVDDSRFTWGNFSNFWKQYRKTLRDEAVFYGSAT